MQVTAGTLDGGGIIAAYANGSTVIVIGVAHSDSPCAAGPPPEAFVWASEVRILQFLRAEVLRAVLLFLASAEQGGANVHVESNDCSDPPKRALRAGRSGSQKIRCRR